MTNLGISQTSSEIKTLNKQDSTLLFENGLMIIKDSSGVTYIAIDYDNLNYIIKLLESNSYDKKKIKQLKRIKNSWQQQSKKKDKIISEKDKKIEEVVKIRIEQDSIIIEQEKTINDLEANYNDCQEQRNNDSTLITNKDIEINSHKKKIKRKNKTILGMVIGYIIIGATIALSVF